MNLEQTVLSIVECVNRCESCKEDIVALEGEVLQFKVTGGSEYRLAFREHTVELDEMAAPTFYIEGSSDVFTSLFKGEIEALPAIMTRRLKVTMDPVRMPRVRRIMTAAIGGMSRDQG